MKVLITGANGKLATYVIRALAGTHDLVLFSRRQPSAEFAQYPWIQGDLTDFAACQRAVEGVDAIQHIGAQPWPVDHPNMRERAAEQGYPFDATFKTNMLGTYYLMQAAVAAGVKTVVMAGSNCALGHGFRISNTPFPISRLPIDETHPTFPEDSYSFTKRAGEDHLASYSRAYGIRTYVTRIAGICPEERRKQIADAIISLAIHAQVRRGKGRSGALIRDAPLFIAFTAMAAVEIFGSRVAYVKRAGKGEPGWCIQMRIRQTERKVETEDSILAGGYQL